MKFLRDRMRHIFFKKTLSEARPHYEYLKNKWTEKHRALKSTLWNKHQQSLHWAFKNLPTRQIAMGSLSGLMLLTPSLSLPSPSLITPAYSTFENIQKSPFLVSDLANVLPQEVRILTLSEETEITRILSRDLGFKVTAELDGKRLNRNYGIIGAEQHLARYPGDTMATHFDIQDEAQKFYSSGMAPGLSAWGYFAPSKNQFTKEDSLKEKYYIAVQTFLSENFNERFLEYRDFFKYRKMVVVNPQNGKAIVAVIGDSGPAVFTGKHLGGSPEVMDHLEREDGAKKGPVLYFFIDDVNNTVPLGPISVK